MTLKQQQDHNITVLKTEFERKASEVHKIFEKTMKNVRLMGRRGKKECNSHNVFVAPAPAPALSCGTPPCFSYTFMVMAKTRRGPVEKGLTDRHLVAM